MSTPHHTLSLKSLELPGAYPFTRGIQKDMYRGKLWTMRQYAGFATAEESNKRYHYLLNHGQKGLSVAFDLPTQMGFDSDHAMSLGEVGKVGVAICTLEDMETLFRGIPLEEVSTSMTINATAAILLCFYLACAQKNKIPFHQLRGTIQNDLLKEYIARGTYIYPPEGSLRLITDIFKFCKDTVPSWNTISISGYHIREAGATAVQEIAFTLANGITYVEAALKAGLPIDEFAPRLSFFFNVHNDFLEEISKFRAARRLWAKIMKERFGAKDERSLKLRFHAQTAGVSLTAQQPHNNVVRVSLQALAAVLGGAQSLHCNGYDEALSLPTEVSAKLALRTQQIIAEETGVINTVDPVGGAFVIEDLTSSLEEGAKQYIDKMDRQGGVIACIKNGYLQAEIQRESYKFQRQIETKEKAIVGVNKYCMEKDQKIETLKIDPALEKKQIEKVWQFKKNRNQIDVQRSIEQIKKVAQTKENLLPEILKAVAANATLGEISDALRDVFGTYQEQVTI
ncbi:MAG: methylmalonyl-CoA mutase [Deltaproteobacteria bacterium]|nr:methylmalonyl-CoA mutase [Deltaproteobacteria bacterium]